MNKYKIAILSARSGRNALAVIQGLNRLDLNCEIACIVGNKSYEAFEQAMSQIQTPVLYINHEKFADRDSYEQELIRFLEEYEVNVVVSCSFSRLLSANFLKKYPLSVNSHPSLLPAFKGRTKSGLKPIDAALEYGVKFVGATVHFIDEHVDNGPIIMQGLMPIVNSEDRELIMDQVLNFEVEMKVQALKWLVQDRISLVDRQIKIKDSKDTSFRTSDTFGIQVFTPGIDEE